MTKKLPPVPEDNQSQKGTGSVTPPTDDKQDGKPENTDQQGRQGNIRQNTRNQGYQQDR